MAKMTYEESLREGIEHIGARGRTPWLMRKMLPGGIQSSEMEDFGQSCVNHVVNNTGNPHACIGLLSDHAYAAALLAWFESCDISAFKQWAYVAGKLDCLARRREMAWLRDFHLLMPLLSDHPGLIDWFAHHEEGHDPKFYLKPSHFADFHSYQIMLALRGEWEPMVRRSEEGLAGTATRLKRFLLDYRFYIALARGDVPVMESLLAELTSPKVARTRNHEFEFGLTEHFISTYGVIFAKLAWRHGYRVQVDTPYIPSEWLPITPLSAYEDIYPFMGEFAFDNEVR